MKRPILETPGFQNRSFDDQSGRYTFAIVKDCSVSFHIWEISHEQLATFLQKIKHFKQENTRWIK